MQEFGSFWTEGKLDAIEKYLASYTTALKHIGFKLCYIDAFAGSGSIKIKGGNEIEGSAVRALRYPFDKFYFFEANQELIENLKQNTSSHKQSRDIEFHNSDCNSFLMEEIEKVAWQKDHWRGVVFLDPYAMDLEWSCLNKISNTRIFDVWYLFPFMALNRNFYKNGKMPTATKMKINRILGTNDWEAVIYSKSLQSSFLDEDRLEKTSIDNIKKFILERLRQTFPTVSNQARLLLNEKNSPQFLLCFAGSNPSKTANGLSLKIADHILSNM